MFFIFDRKNAATDSVLRNQRNCNIRDLVTAAVSVEKGIYFPTDDQQPIRDS